MAKLPTLTAAEKKLIACAASGDVANFRTRNKKTKRISAKDPRNNPIKGGWWGKTRTIRASVLLRLLTDPPDEWPVHSKGILIFGAKITGDISLEATEIKYPFMLLGCRVMSIFFLTDTKTQGLFFM